MGNYESRSIQRDAYTNISLKHNDNVRCTLEILQNKIDIYLPIRRRICGRSYVRSVETPSYVIRKRPEVLVSLLVRSVSFCGKWIQIL